jgi:hypothetical protein
MEKPGEASITVGQQLCLTLGRPSALWSQPLRRVIGYGLLMQWAILSLGKIIAMPENRDLAHLAEGSNPTAIRVADLVLLVFATAFTVLAANLALAALLWGIAALLGLSSSFTQLTAVASVALLPLMLGRAVGLTLLALWMPLSHSPTELWAWRLWPFSAGLATWLPNPPPALSLGWAFLSVIDVFGIWTLWLLYVGMVHGTGIPARLRPWVGVMLVLLCCAVALGLWQAGQFWLARTT